MVRARRHRLARRLWVLTTSVVAAAVASGALPAGYAVADGAGLVFEGVALRECVASRAGARVIRVHGSGVPPSGARPSSADGVTEELMPVRLLAEAEDGTAPDGESQAVSELRDLRAGRHRWD